ncbi:ABC transporter ATP-binding protein [Lederbergia galactosidilytica]|uniref:ABC transporter ATP-binding protein n=1 Tax=Lederbergia galactosidilytica TaxID=217031 RepID=A0A177ZHE9_9BACI|nr:ABC transporter ATP-binding protein [Lederbergia galactosidilytica]OAK67352.1 ABC transporter ATP-binding protein [Lederbergia galactosidilytica]
MYAIETNQLLKAYGSTPVVKGMNLHVAKGEIFGFLGRNGAGKSTFINMLTGIVHPSSGEYSLLGIKGPNDRVKQHIGVMPDYSTFYPALSALEHLRFLSSLSKKPATKERCLEVLQQVGLEEHARKKTAKFSFGMKKKLGIAQAIIHDPDLIFLDEPTSGIDAESALHIHQLIRQLHKNGKTVFMTSHNLDEVEKLCTRIAIMKDGQIDKIGTMDELRAFYRSTLTVKIKHSPIPESKYGIITHWLQTIGTDMEINNPYLSLNLPSEKRIAELIHAFTEWKIDIFRVEVKEPSLEEIFMNKRINKE